MLKQVQALRVMAGGDSVFLTGPPGSGKTYILRKYIQWAKKHGKRLAITASTGIAATHIGGTTIHSWSGLGIRDELKPNDHQWLTANERLIKRYNNTDVLIIDEVSMLHGKRLDMINEVCKLLREDTAPFGGLQVILTGDLFQLPPINRFDSIVDFVHTSAAWKELQPQICYLSEQHRQSGDALLDLLEAMRGGEVEEAHFESLRSRLGLAAQDSSVTKLYSHNVDVEEINSDHLAAIKESEKLFLMQKHGSQAKVEQLTKSVLAPENLILKVGAEVMFVANNFAEGYVNGSRGRVVGFVGGAPKVQLQRSERVITVVQNSWALEEDGKEVARVTQLPLRLAWAITIHKSQGMSLDSAEIDLSRAFTPGMGYVALSRIRSLDGVYLKGINNTALAMHPEIFSFDIILKQASNELAKITSDEPIEETVKPPAASADSDPALLELLLKWRHKEATSRHVPLYMVASNKTLKGLAQNRPVTVRQLQAVSGIGPKIVERYGTDLVAQIRSHLGVVDVKTDGSKLESFLAERGVYFSAAELQELRDIVDTADS